jgi:hypothetical protein
MSRRSGPPRLAVFLLARVTEPAARPYILGDLREEFRELASDRGGAAARRWYWRQVGGSVGPLLGERLAASRPLRAAGETAVGITAAVLTAVCFGTLLEFLVRRGAEPSAAAVSLVVVTCALLSATGGGLALTWAAGRPRAWMLFLVGLVVVAPETIHALRHAGSAGPADTVLPLALALPAALAGLVLGRQVRRPRPGA